jgi:RNA polymerase sigma-70 factor (ECF subfamily)
LAEQATDERLLEQAADGNTAAFQILYERYRDPIFRFAYRMLGSVEAAEDVAHDCFLSLIKEPGR